nr:hypothetical protein [Lichenicola cladoniae]
MAHQAGDTVHANPLSLSTKCRVHVRTAIDGAVVGMDVTNSPGQVAIGNNTCTFWPSAPRIVAAGTDLKHRTDEPDRVDPPVVFDEAEPHLAGPEKMPMAFLKTSRSI